jgi:hypothetical protein
MSKSFPVRPNLEQLKKQAKDLLKSHKSGDPDGLRRIQENHPDWGKRSTEELCATRFLLGDAQLVIAREYGCASWPKLKTQVESILAANKNPVAAPASGITWKNKAYFYFTSIDGKRKWLDVKPTLQEAYQPPGWYRETEIDAQEQICRVTITDTVRGRKLICLPDKKKARLTEIEQFSSFEQRSSGQLWSDPRGPFVRVFEAMKKENPQWVETRKTAAGTIDVFRLFDKERKASCDVWINQRTKRPVEIHIPGSDTFDPETDPARDNPPGKEWSDSDLVGVISYDIAFDVALDESLFRLDPPEGYVVESPPPFTEQDVIDYLNIAAEYNKKTFPDQVVFSFDNFQSLQTWGDPLKTVFDRMFTEAQQRFLDYGPGAPVNPFIRNSTEENTFRYLGKGVKLGDQDHVVCWYRPKGASHYRVVYGDLTVKDLPPEELGAIRLTLADAQSNTVAKGTGITWKTIFYERRFSKDGKRNWVRVAANRQTAYKPPGLYRTTYNDDRSRIHYVEISDAIHRRQLKWWPNQKKARLSESEQIPSEQLPQDPRGPFVWITEAMKKENLQWVETRVTATGEVNVFRHFIKDEFRFAVDIKEENTSWDVWIDQKTKQLVEFHNPGSDVFDPEKDPARHNPPEKEWAYGKAAGHIDYDIVFDAELNDSLFLLEPPEGYVVENRVQPPLPQVTEQEVIDYFAVIAEVNSTTFPDQFDSPFSFDVWTRLWTMPKDKRTTAEQKLETARNHYNAFGLISPADHFIKNNTEENSFRYLGKGVKLGDKDRIVCWYKLKGANSYRVIYGDLTVKDLPPEALPLSVEP